MAPYVVAITRAGKDVMTATDIRDFVFHSDYKVWKSQSPTAGTITVASAGVSAVGTISHGLNYNPTPYTMLSSSPGTWVAANQFTLINRDPDYLLCWTESGSAQSLIQVQGFIGGVTQQYDFPYKSFTIIDEL